MHEALAGHQKTTLCCHSPRDPSALFSPVPDYRYLRCAERYYAFSTLILCLSREPASRERWEQSHWHEMLYPVTYHPAMTLSTKLSRRPLSLPAQTTNRILLDTNTHHVIVAKQSNSSESISSDALRAGQLRHADPAALRIAAALPPDTAAGETARDTNQNAHAQDHQHCNEHLFACRTRPLHPLYAI